MNYVDNCKSKQLQTLCRKELLKKFCCALNPELKKTIDKVRAEEDKDKRSKLKQALPALLFQGKLDEELYKQYTKRCKEERIHYTKRLNTRNTSFLRPTGLFMMDFDRDCDSAKALYEKFLKAIEHEGINPKEFIALAHRTVGGNGLRLVLKRRPSHTIAEDQQWIAQLMGEPIDEVCTDLARLSYMVTCWDLFDINLDILYDDTLGEAFTNEGLWQPHQPLPTKGQKSKPVKAQKAAGTTNTTQAKKRARTAASQPQKYQYPPITSIDEEGLIKAIVADVEKYKGKIREGIRNSAYFKMALLLISLLNDPQRTEQLLVKTSAMYGHDLPLDEIQEVTWKASRRTSTFIPLKMCRYINQGKYFIGGITPPSQPNIT